MKRLLPFLVFILIFGCKQSEEALKNNRRKEYLKARKFAIQDTLIIKDIFLSFEFGDTETEFNKKKEALLKEGRIDNRYEWNYVYLNTPNGERKASFLIVPEFLNDKLSQLKLISQVEDNFDTHLIWQNMFIELCFKNHLHIDYRNFADFEFDKYEFQIYNSLKNRFPLFKGLYHNLELYVYTNVYNQIIVKYTDLSVQNEQEIPDNDLLLEKYIP